MLVINCVKRARICCTPTVFHYFRLQNINLCVWNVTINHPFPRLIQTFWILRRPSVFRKVSKNQMQLQNFPCINHQKHWLNATPISHRLLVNSWASNVQSGRGSQWNYVTITNRIKDGCIFHFKKQLLKLSCALTIYLLFYYSGMGRTEGALYY